MATDDFWKVRRILAEIEELRNARPQATELDDARDALIKLIARWPKASER
jgi:hypothetical protein